MLRSVLARLLTGIAVAGAYLHAVSLDALAQARMAEKFPTAALAILVHQGEDWRDLGPGSCLLHSFTVARDLEPAGETS